MSELFVIDHQMNVMVQIISGNLEITFIYCLLFSIPYVSADLFGITEKNNPICDFIFNSLRRLVIDYVHTILFAQSTKTLYEKKCKNLLWHMI